MPRFNSTEEREQAVWSLTAAGREPVTEDQTQKGLYPFGGEKGTRRKLQVASWDFFNKIGEVHYVADSIVGSRVGQLAWYPAWRDDGSQYTQNISIDKVPSNTISDNDKKILNKVVASLKTEQGGVQDFYSRIAVSLFVAGELFILGEPTDEPGIRKWSVHPVEDVRWSDASGERIYETADNSNLDSTGNKIWEEHPSGTVGIQIWKPHPNDPQQPDSPLFHVLDILDELLWITRLISSRLRQRIGLSGFLLIANSMAGPDFNPNDTSADMSTKLRNFEAQMIKRAESNYKLDQRGLPIAPSLPLVASVPPDLMPDKAIAHIPLENDINEWLLLEREAVIQRFGSGVSVPVELITGMGNLTHWNAWLIDKQLDMQHIDPLAQLIAESITNGYLQAEIENLIDQGVLESDPEELRKIRIWFARNTLINHPDQLEQFFTAYKLGIVGAGPILDIMGIDPESALSDDEREWFLLINGVIQDQEQSDDAPSRQRTGNRQDSGRGPADESRRDDDGLGSKTEALAAIIQTTTSFARQRAGNRTLSYALKNPSLRKQAEEAPDASEVGRYVSRDDIVDLGLTTEGLFSGVTQPLQTWARANHIDFSPAQWATVLAHIEISYFDRDQDAYETATQIMGMTQQ